MSIALTLGCNVRSRGSIKFVWANVLIVNIAQGRVGEVSEQVSGSDPYACRDCDGRAAPC